MKTYVYYAIGMMLAVVLMGNTGCEPGRLADLADCGKASIGIGFGLEAHAKVGCLTHPSVGFPVSGSMIKVGHENRKVTGVWEESRSVSPFVPYIGFFMTGNPAGLNISLLSNASPFGSMWRDSDLDAKPLKEKAEFWLPLLELLNDDTLDKYDPLAFGEITDFELGGMLVFVSADVGINPLEIADFLLGFVGLDIAGDDPKPEKEKEPAPEVPNEKQVTVPN